MKKEKEKFLQIVNVSCGEGAIKNSLKAALQRNPTYLPSVPERKREAFRQDWANKIQKTSLQYKKSIRNGMPIKNICSIAKELSRSYSDILREKQLRLGTSQKALNLYLKFLWCLDDKRCAPPHCPLDGKILRLAKEKGSWTRLNCVCTYKEWIAELLKRANGEKNLAEWELKEWNKLKGLKQCDDS